MKLIDTMKKNWGELNFWMKVCTVATSPIWLLAMLCALVMAGLLIGLFEGVSLFDEEKT